MAGGAHVYGESLGNTDNHLARVYQVFDAAGLAINLAYDFKGNLLRGLRQLATDYAKAPDWSRNPAPKLENPLFATTTAFDALNRSIAVTSPDGSVYRPTFNEANLLEGVVVNLRGAPAPTGFVTNIDYNAKGSVFSLTITTERGRNTLTIHSLSGSLGCAARDLADLTRRLRNSSVTRWLSRTCATLTILREISRVSKTPP